MFGATAKAAERWAYQDLERDMATSHEEVWGHLHSEVTLLHAQWQTFLALFGVSHERVQLLNRSAGLFFSVIQQTLLRDLYVGLTRLIDPLHIRGQQNLTLERLLLDPRVSADQALLALTQQKVEAAKQACQPFRTHRNKALAHLDLTTKLAGGRAALPGVTRKMIEDALRAIADVLNTVDQHLNGNITVFDHVYFAGGDAEALVRCLERAERWKKEDREVRLQKRMGQQMP